MEIPYVPTGAAVLGPDAVDAEFSRQINELKAQIGAKKITPEEFERALRSMVDLKTTRSDPIAVGVVLKEIHRGSPKAYNSSLVKMKLPADGRIPLIIPDGHDDSMDKDMSNDLGSWGNQ